MNDRFNALQDWLENQVGIHTPQLLAITNDASFRRYFRVKIDGIPHIVMDAPPDKEDCGPFIDVAQRLQVSGLNAPKIVASDHEQGFLLLTDLGSQLYLPALNETQVDGLYGDAIQALVVMQKNVPSEGLPLYNHSLLHTEMGLFTNWLVNKHLKLSLSTAVQASLENCFELLSSNALSQPQVFVHRDYHSRNLMIVTDNNPGILDFQDAVKGAITYDLVSLLRDCYIAWPIERVQIWAKSYYTQAQQAGILKNIEVTQFIRWFDWMGIQRHLKASGIFARLYHRDGKSGYLKDIPRTLNYIVEVSANYPELSSLHELVSQQVLPNCQAEIF
jgi:aminoglycoside/choline kinase family phosphotransferase